MYYQNEQLGVDEVCVQTEPSLRHDTGFIFSENQILSVTNEPAGSYRLRARGARDATEEEQTISPWWTDYDPYIVRAKAVEVLFLMASPTQAQVFADPTFRDKALKAMNRAAARYAAGLDTAPWIPGDAFIPAWLVERMAASGLAPLAADAYDPVAAAAAPDPAQGIILLGYEDAAGRALMASVKADLIAAGFSIAAEHYAASAQESWEKLNGGDPSLHRLYDIVHLRWLVPTDNAGAFFRLVEQSQILNAGVYANANDCEYEYFHELDTWYGALRAENDRLATLDMIVPLAWREE